jgi:hypothetical protein
MTAGVTLAKTGRQETGGRRDRRQERQEAGETGGRRDRRQERQEAGDRRQERQEPAGTLSLAST